MCLGWKQKMSSFLFNMICSVKWDETLKKHDKCWWRKWQTKWVWGLVPSNIAGATQMFCFCFLVFGAQFFCLSSLLLPWESGDNYFAKYIIKEPRDVLGIIPSSFMPFFFQHILLFSCFWSIYGFPNKIVNALLFGCALNHCFFYIYQTSFYISNYLILLHMCHS